MCRKIVLGIMTVLFAAILSTADAHASESEPKPLRDCMELTECKVFGHTYTANLYIDFKYDLTDSGYNSSNFQQLKSIEDQWYIIYQADPENTLTITTESGKTTKAALEQNGWIVSGAGVFYAKELYGSSTGTGSRRMSLEGKKQPNGVLYQGLIPSTDYSYYIAFGQDKEMYLKTEKKRFSSWVDTMTTSPVKGKIVSADNGYRNSRVRFRLDYGDYEGEGIYIAGYYCGTDTASLKTATITGGSLGYTNEDDDDYGEEGINTVYFPYCPEGSVLYALVYTGTGAGDHLTAVKLDADQPLILTKTLSENNISIDANSVTGGIAVNATIADPAYDTTGVGGVYCRAYIKEHDQEEYIYQRTNRRIVNEDDLYCSWSISGQTAKGEIQFSIGDVLYYYVDEEQVKPPLTIAGDKVYDMKVFVGWDVENGDSTEFHEVYHKEFENLTPSPDVFIQNSEFDTGLLAYLKDRLNRKYRLSYGEDLSAAGLYYTDNGISSTALGRINSIGYDTDFDADDDISPNDYDIKSLKGIKNLTNLKRLWIEGLSSLKDAQELSTLENLQEVILSEDHLEQMPDLSDFEYLRYFDLSWNWIPAATITADKVPATLASYYDEDGLVQNDLTETLDHTRDNQYSAESFSNYEKSTKLTSETAAHPFTLHIGKGKLKSWHYYNYKTAYYRLEATSGNVAVTQQSMQKVFVINPKTKGMTEAELQEYEEDLINFGLDKVVRGDTAFDLEIGSVAGLTGFGKKSVDYKIYKVRARYSKGSQFEDVSEELLYSGTAEITYYDNADVTGLTVTPAEKELTVGETAALTAVIAPEYAEDKTVEWTTSDDKIAKVDTNGTVTAVAAGEATITATSNNNKKATGTCKITVKEKTAEDQGNNDGQDDQTDTKPQPVKVASISLDKTSIIVKKGSTQTLTATVLPENADNKIVTWTSTNAAVATVDAGVVTAAGTGRATITATTADGGLKAECEVLVVDETLNENQLKMITEEEYTGDYKPADETAKSDEKSTKKVPKVKVGKETIKMPVTIESYQTAITYTGKSIKPEDLGADIDTSAITDTLTLKEGATITADQLVSVSFVPSSNKSAGEKATFYGKIKISPEAKKVLSSKEYKKLKKEVQAVNKELKKKANTCKFTINKRSVTDGTLVVSVKKTDGAISLNKKSKVEKVNYIQLITKDAEGNELKIKLTSKDYKIEVIDAATGLVKVTGKTNFTGTTTVYVE